MNEGPTRFHLGHRPALDGLRGVAVLIVVLYHAEVPFLHGGFLGVDIFFVLSGFLITSLLLEEWQRTGHLSLRRFYIRRALRLLPALYVLLLVVALFTFLFVTGPLASANFVGILLALIYSSNWGLALGIDSLGALSHTWSLALEEQFYLVWPFTLMLFLSWGRRSPVRLIAITIMLMVFSSALRATFVLANGTALSGLSGFDTRADSLLAGSLVAILLTYYPITPAVFAKLLYFLRLALPPGLSVTALLICISSGWWPLLKLGGFTFVALSIALLITYLVLCTESLPARLLSSKPLVQMGVLSYGIYLWHAPVFVLLPLPSSYWPDWQNWPVQVARIAITTVCVLLSYFLVERPILRLKARFSNVDRAGVSHSVPVVTGRSPAQIAVADGAILAE